MIIVYIKSSQTMQFKSWLFICLLATFAVFAQGACNVSHPYDYGASCFAQCPWNSTLVTYLSSTTCVTSTHPNNQGCASSGLYADDSTKKCVPNCPSTPIKTFKDTVHSRCVQNCTTNPSFHAYNQTNTCVQYCPSPYWALENYVYCTSDCPIDTYYQISGSFRGCVQICYPNYYSLPTNRTCVLASSCPSTPVAYFGDDSTGLCVQKCPVAQGTYGDNSTRKCVLHCPLGSFADSVSLICLSVCPSVPPSFGSNTTRNCLLLCNEGQFADGTTQQCVLRCPSGSYGDYYSRKCVDICPLEYSTFADNLTNLCVPLCPANYYADNFTRFCVSSINCSNSTFGDPVTQTCVAASNCSYGFFVDTAQGLCVVRCSTWGNQINRFCEDVCPWNPPIYFYYKDPSTNLCVERCPQNPRYFGDNDTRTCVSQCPIGTVGNPADNKCLLTCPSGFFADNVLRICVATCTQNTTVIKYFYTPNLTCVDACPTGYFADNSTLGCQLTCTSSTFGHQLNNTCLPTCPQGYFGDNYTMLCVTSCPIQNGQYADPSTNLCVDMCPQIPDLYGEDINNNNNTCVTSCSVTGFFADPLSRICVAVCDTAQGLYGYQNDWRCYERCPTGYGNPLTSQCVQICPRFPKFYYGDNMTRTCVLSCPNQTYGDRSTNLCVSGLNCSTGTYGDDLTGLCTGLCNQLLNYFGDPTVGKCVTHCSFPLYADDITQLCKVDCSSSANRFMDNASLSCVSTCPALPDTFGDANSGYCEYNCTNGYFGYASGTKRVCVSMCPSTPAYLADLQSMVCVLECANLTYMFSNNTFRGCLYTCPAQIFNTTLSIDLFQDNSTWTCVQVCPYGYYAFKHPSDTTIRECVRKCPMVGPTYYFGQDTTRTCVLNCPMMSQATYGDRIDFRCVSTCSRSQYRDNVTRECVYDCQNTYYANNVTWNCSQWCNNEYFAYDGNNTCAKACPTGLYGYQNKCYMQCPNQTWVYNQNDNTTWLCVDKCPAYPDYYADNYTVSCVFRCTNGTFADAARRVCLPALNCSDTTIADPVSGRCVLQCTKDPMYFLTVDTNTCGATCANGSFAYNQTNICLTECPAPYFGVNSTNNFYCTQYCPVDEYMWVNGTTRMCIPYCPGGLYRDNLTMVCVQLCPDYYYANVSNLMCVLGCAPLYADDYTKTCVDICPNGTTASNVTYQCKDYCQYGQFQLDKVCYSVCPWPLFADNLTRTCLTSCPGDPLTYADSVNRKCSLTCNASQYAFMPNLTCLAVCPDGYYRQITHLLCLDVCLEGYYADNQTLNCLLSCSASNFSFADPTSGMCVQLCPSDPDLYGHTNKCITQCPSGWYAENFTRTCVQICPNISSIYLNASWADTLTRRCLSTCSSLSYALTNDTHNDCVNMCPEGTWASISTQSCEVQCPNNTYAYNTTNICVEECPPGEWADLVNRVCMPSCTFNASLYADDSTDSCVQICPDFPDMFAYQPTQKCVLTCLGGTFALNDTRTCQINCPFPYFADTESLQCVLICPIHKLTYADNQTRKCEVSCVNHTVNGSTVLFYADNATMSCVVQCPELPNKFYGYNQTNLCLQACPVGTWGDNDTRVCLDICVFQDPKFQWMDRLTNFCVDVCPYGYYADNQTGFCELTCSNGTYADDSTRRCVYNCPINPTSYSTVVGGYGVCVYNCISGTYSSEVSISCVTTCPTQPQIYYTYSPTNACVKQCVYPYFAVTATKACTTSCDVGFYGNVTTKKCQICQVQCVTCTGYLVCTSCITGFFLYEISCVISCPTYPVLYFAHKQSGVCFLTCPSPFFGEVSTGLCQLTCPSITYPSLTTRICTACPSGCITCDAIGCYACYSNYTFHQSTLTCNQNCNSTHRYTYNSVCYSICPDGSYLSYDLVTCFTCSLPCKTCNGTAGNCTSCVQSYYYLGQCLTACPTNYFVDAGLKCQSCTTNPQRCILPPLTYTIYPFTKNYKLQSYCIFNRAVNLTLAQFTSEVQITYNGAAVKSSQFAASVYNSTTFLVIFNSAGSLNQNALSFSFTPGTITDQYGNMLTTVTVGANITVSTGVNAEVAAVSESVSSGTKVVSYFFLALLGLLFIKSGYPALITLEIVQLIYMNIFLFSNPLPYLENQYLGVLQYFHFTFLPKILPAINLTNPTYAQFSSDVSFLSNSPVILLFAFVVVIYLVVSLLSSKRFISNKGVRKLFKKIRKYRMRYGIIHDVFWATYLYAVFISLLQFKLGNFSTTNNILNMMLAIVIFLTFFAFTCLMVYLGVKYKNSSDKIPKKYAFLMMEPSAHALEMPMRYVRKLLYCLGLMMGSIQTQGVVLLGTSVMFISFFGCYKPAKSPLTNKVVIVLELGLIILLGLFLGYDRIIDKTIDNQQGFALALVAIQSLMIMIALIWSMYRLVLVIRESQTWKLIYAKVTKNTDPDYLREQQRKRDLQFDFGSLENRSLDERTEHPMGKISVKDHHDQKFNIFDQDDKEEPERVVNMELQKPLRGSIKKSNRPSSVDSSEVVAMRSNVSKSQELFDARKSAQNYRKAGHLQIKQNDDIESVEQVKLNKEKGKGLVSRQPEPEGKRGRVLWQELDIDEQDL